MASTPNWTTKSTKVQTGTTIVDPKLTTISQSNDKGWTKVSATTTDPILQKLEYAIQTDGKVTYRYTPPPVGGGRGAQPTTQPEPRLFNNFQEMANLGGIPGFNNQTSLRLTDSMQKNLQSRSARVGAQSPTAPNESGGDANAGTEGNPTTSIEDASKNSEKNIDTIRQQIGEGNYRKKYSGGKTYAGSDIYMYPVQRNSNQDYIKFTMYRFAPKKATTDVKDISKGASFTGSNKQKDPLGTVLLPIQPQISDSNRVVWGERELNAFESLAGVTALGTIEKGSEALTDVFTGINELVKSNKSDLSSAAAAFFAQRALGANSDFFTRVTGAILNPNLELLFQGPSLRSFNFNFTMSAREKDESVEIRNIIRFFKQGMSVKRTKTNLFLQAPNVFDISYVYGKTNKDHPWINKIKTCALQDCSVNYTPEGTYATYEDGSMTQYQMSLTFSEIDPIYDDDYEGQGKDITTEIGY